VMAPPQLSVSLGFTQAVSVKLDSLFGRICLIFRSLNQVTNIHISNKCQSSKEITYCIAIIT
jgi:hypothetical protein